MACKSEKQILEVCILLKIVFLKFLQNLEEITYYSNFVGAILLKLLSAVDIFLQLLQQFKKFFLKKNT